jgi:hypothetical protein
MRRLIVFAAVALAMSGSALAKTEIFAPTGPWAIDYADHNCKLMRNFGNGERELTFGLQRAELGPRLMLEIAGETVDFATRAGTVKYRYGPGGREREGALGRLSNALRISDAPLQEEFIGSRDWTEWSYEAERDAAKAINSVSVSGPFGDEIVLQLGPMEAPIEALQNCVDDLMGEWGIDARRLAAASRHALPTSDPQTWLGKEDYPREMRQERRGGTVHLMLIVNEQGRVARCIGIASDGQLGDVTCNALIERASFVPALDAEGEPMVGLFVTDATFRTIIR